MGNKDFRDFYDQELSVEIKRINDTFKINTKEMHRYGVLMFVATAVMSLWLWRIGAYSDYETLFMPFMGFMASLYVYTSQGATKRLVKTILIPKLVSFISPSYRYESKAAVDESYFISSGLYDYAGNGRYSGEDLIYGEEDDVAFQFSDVSVEIKNHDMRLRKEWRELFKGQLYVAQFNKSFVGFVSVVPTTHKLGFFNADKASNHLPDQRDSLERAEMDNEDFNKKFNVRTDDQILARYILTPSMMELLLKFSEKYENAARFSFKDGKMFVTIQGIKNMFDQNLKKDGADYDQAIGYYQDITAARDMINELKLNEKIWR